MSVEMDKLSFVRQGVTEEAVDFNMTADTPSRPVDFVVSSVHSRCVISSSVQSRSDGQFSGLSGVGLLRGGKE